jgi:hypothetical protein
MSRRLSLRCCTRALSSAGAPGPCGSPSTSGSNLLLVPPAEPPGDRAEDITDALSLLRAARENLDSLEGALLLAARQPATGTSKPLLTFRQIATAIGAESEQAAQGRYRRKVGNLNGSDSGNDGTP